MSPVKMSKIESVIRVVLKFHEAFNRHDVSGMMQLMSEDCKVESSGPAPDGTAFVGKKAATQYWLDFFQRSPQVHLEIEDIFGLGKHCIMRWEASKLNDGGQYGHVRGVDIFRVGDGLISEHLSYVKG